jgi:hypothetical protein
MLDDAAINAQISYGRTSTRAADALYLPGRMPQPENCPSGPSLDFSNSISLWRRMKPATAVFSGNKGQIGSGRSAVV